MHQKVNKKWFHYSSPEKHGRFYLIKSYDCRSRPQGHLGHEIRPIFFRCKKVQEYAHAELKKACKNHLTLIFRSRRCCLQSSDECNFARDAFKKIVFDFAASSVRSQWIRLMRWLLANSCKRLESQWQMRLQWKNVCIRGFWVRSSLKCSKERALQSRTAAQDEL